MSNLASKKRPPAPEELVRDFFLASRAFKAWFDNRQHQDEIVRTNEKIEKIISNKHLTCEEKREAIEKLASSEQLPPSKNDKKTTITKLDQELAQLAAITTKISKDISGAHSPDDALKAISLASHFTRAILKGEENPCQKSASQIGTALFTKAAHEYGKLVGEKVFADPTKPVSHEVVQRGAHAYALAA